MFGLPPTFVSLAAYFLIGILIVKRNVLKEYKFHLRLFLLSVIIFIIYYYFLPIHIPDYYFIGIMGLFFIYFSTTLGHMGSRNKIGYVLIMLVIILSNLFLLKRDLLETRKISLKAKETIMRIIAQKSPDNMMELNQDIIYGLHYGFGYLQRYYNISPIGGDNVPKYTIVVPKSKRQSEISVSSGNVGLIIN